MDVLTECVTFAQRAPTGFNTQAYVAIVVRSAEDRENLAGAMIDANVGKIKQAPVAVVFAADCEHDPNVSTEAWAYKQTTFAVATFLYAAQVHGLATCPMEGLDQAKVKKALNIPDRYSIPVVVALGHENPDAKPAKPSVRLPPKEVFFEGKFGQPLENLFEEN
ncbi:unnamed protein product [Phytophthora fragariaefolia]|uniref:Unnamed protein product n=1 Tax=Phytophthora fragariaefolia TaxID=1490495 RepID=A0A9W7D4S5_9STRA|nr:unnamed protein product [Phytophthora fragariaefolia]